MVKCILKYDVILYAVVNAVLLIRSNRVFGGFGMGRPAPSRLPCVFNQLFCLGGAESYSQLQAIRLSSLAL